MVFTLEQLGYLKKHVKTQRYHLTVQALELGFNYLSTNTLIDIANPFLAELSNITQETRSAEHTSELQPIMRISYADCCLNTTKYTINNIIHTLTYNLSHTS